MSSDGLIIESVPFEDTILPVPLRFPPPYADLAINPDGFRYSWQLIEYAFHLPRPTDFPALKDDLTADERAAARRYIDTCRRLAGYTLMSSEEGVSFREVAGNATVVTNFAPIESLTAFAVGFRQIHEQGEKASFRAVHSILGRHIHTIDDGDNDQRSDYLRHWRISIGKLYGTMLKPYVARLVADSMNPTGRNPIRLPFEDVRPLEVMSRWNYGELIHWGEKRSALEAALGRDEVWNALERQHVAGSMIGLAHLYFGFSQVVEQAVLQQPIDV